MLNPMLVEGQIRGGVVQGMGTALFAEIPYDGTSQPLAGTLADYLMPGAAEMPAIKIGHLHTPTPHTEYGVKGMGEGGGRLTRRHRQHRPRRPGLHRCGRQRNPDHPPAA